MSMPSWLRNTVAGQASATQKETVAPAPTVKSADTSEDNHHAEIPPPMPEPVAETMPESTEPSPENTTIAATTADTKSPAADKRQKKSRGKKK